MTFIFDASSSNIDFSSRYNCGNDATGSDDDDDLSPLQQMWGRQGDDGRTSPDGISQSAVFTAEGNSLFVHRRNEKALEYFNRALSIDPNNCNCLIARSKCHLQLGDHTAALKDAEAALRIDQHSYKAIYQKAEALYARGDFELALVFYCRGAQARKELDCFRLGVQKAQEAISNVVGQPHCLQIDAADIAKIPEVARQFACHGEVESLENQMLTTSVMTKNKNRRANKAGNKVLLDRHGGNKDRKDDELNQASKAAGALGSHKLLGKLQSDMEYLQNLLHHPGLQPITIPTMIGIPGAAGATPTAANSTNDKNKMVSSQVKEALGYLKSRQEFWQQQKPIRRGRK